VGITALLLPPKEKGRASHPEKLLFSGSQDGVIRVWDLERRSCTRILSGHQNAILQLALDPRTEILASSSLDETVKGWNLAPLFQGWRRQGQQEAAATQECTFSFPCKGSTGVTILDSILIFVRVGKIKLCALPSLVEIRTISFDDTDHDDFDPAVIINSLHSHETGILFDYGDRVKVFHFSEIAVTKKNS